MENFSPMLQQYLSLKKSLDENTLLFFRLGDFYELFFDDAILVSKELDLILTARAAGNNQKAPMCGVPHHAANTYLQRLVDRGYKIAIAEQTQDPAEAKGLVKREITTIITQGTNLESSQEFDDFLVCFDEDLLNYHLCFYSISNNQLFKKSIEADPIKLIQILKKYRVKEILVYSEKIAKQLNLEQDFPVTIVTKPKAKDILVETIRSYILYTKKLDIIPKEIGINKQGLQLDHQTILNLELIQPQRLNSKSKTLYQFLNYTKTPMGKRKLKQWIIEPLYDYEEIIQRQNQIKYLKNDFILSTQIRSVLEEIYDLERLSTKILFKQVTPQDIIRILHSLKAFNQLKQFFSNSPLSSLTQFNPNSIIDLIEKTIKPNPSSTIKEGQVIKEGYHPILDEYRELLTNGSNWLLEYEKSEKEKTGIKNLKVGFSRTFGYYVEVSKGQIDLVKDEFGYMPRQTLTTAQRYITQTLKEHEDALQSAEIKCQKLEESLFELFVESLVQTVELTQEIAQAIGVIDTLYSLSIVSQKSGFITPQFNLEHRFELIQGQHPILLETQPINQVISNDCVMDDNTHLLLLTGPNMGGKSTYMRQIAISVIMAQMGCDIPAKKANLPLIDQIFTRMGASDDILANQSTFMVEMVEANHALSNATKNSLVLFDEIGRGTSTYDGVAIAQSMMEYLAETIGCKSIFSTHYHELTQVAENIDSIKNVQVSVSEINHKIIFLYKVIEGSASKSYGIHVAQLAGLPNNLVLRAKQVLKTYHQQPIIIENEVLESEIIKQIENLDINQMTPIEALTTLSKLKEIVSE